MVLLFDVQTWRAAHDVSGWTSWPALAGVAVFTATFLVLVVRGLARASRYRAVDALREAERQLLVDQIAEAEARTTGEIAVVVLERSDRHPAAEWLAGSLSLFFGSIFFVGWLPWESSSAFFLCQLGLGAAGFYAARWIPGFKRVFVSEPRAEEMAREQAAQEFFHQDLHRTTDRTGVLLFVSLFERRAIVLADEAIDARIAPGDWRPVDAAVLAGIRGGSLFRGLADGVRLTAELLAEHFPREGERAGEVPDHVIVRRE